MDGDTDTLIGVNAIYSTSYDDKLYGSSLAEFFTGFDGNDIIYGYGGGDKLTGGAGDDIIYGGDGTDQIYGGGPGAIDAASANQLYGGNGDDFFFVHGGNDTIDGGSGDNEINYYYADAAVFVDIASGTTDEGINGSINDTFTGSTRVAGSAFNDILWGSASADRLEGNAGDDEIRGLGGNDTFLRGDDGNDLIYGGDGNDTLYGGNNDDTLYGEAGNDTLRGDAGNDLLVYSAGWDAVSDSSGTDTLFLTGSLTINDMAIANLSTYDAKITITATSEELTILDLRNGDPNKHIETISFDDGFVTSLPDYTGWLNGTSGNDTVAGNGSDNTLIGFDGNDTMNSGAGNDDVHGGAGNDTIYGDDGTDLLHGGADTDALYGGDGLDTLFGGTGADTFKFETASALNNVDVVKDFSTAQADIIDLADILGAAYNPLSDAIADFVSFSESSGSTFVSVDRDGTGGTYSMAQIIKLENVTGLASVETLETNGNLIAA